MTTSQEALDQLSLSARISLGDSKTIFITFVDLCGSTNFKTYCRERDIPDGIWIERQLIFLNRVVRRIQRYNGVIIKTIGDEVMAYFDSSTDSDIVLKCMTEIHTLFGDIKKYDKDLWRIESKVSIDFGEIYDSNLQLLKDDTIDPVGIIVDRCARLNGVCKPSEVIFSSSFFSILKPALQLKYARLKEENNLRGIGMSELYRMQVGIITPLNPRVSPSDSSNRS
jgi:class 3 adenylate cyclase